MPVATLAAHALAAFLVLIAPLLAYRHAHRPDATAPGARLRRYRWLVLRQVLLIGALFAWIAASGVAPARVGLGAPYSWWFSAGGAVVVAAFLSWSAVALRRRAGDLREKMRGRAGALLLPETNEEARWFALVCLCGGIAEELGYRGFLFYYALTWFPSLNPLELVLATSICFGIAHAYQGWRGVVATTVAGLVMGGLYVATGNLLLPVVAHILGNMRAVVIFWSPARDRS
jgi:membrane protease YdiL (CAAX protease family)